MSRLYYLATPYTKYKTGPEQAYKDACKQAVFLLDNGIHVFSPIAHSHGIVGFIPIESYIYKNMMEWDYKFLNRCDGLIVCMLDDWENSHGVDLEVEFAKAHHIPIYYMTPNEVPEIES